MTPRSVRNAASERTAASSTDGKADEGMFGSESSSEGLQGVYIISVAARILEMHPQTLRKYERMGLISPSRTVGMLRLYSEEDIARLKLIKHLVGDLGLNLAGVQLVLHIFNQLLYLRARARTLEGQELERFVDEGVGEMLASLYR